MKNAIRLLFALAVSAVLLLSCEPMTGGSDLSSIEGSVFKVTSMNYTGGVVRSMSMPYVVTGDMDGDSTVETITANMYMYLASGTSYSYTKTTISDGGTTTGMLGPDESTSKDTGTYTLSGSTITIDTETMNFAISGSTVTFSASGVVDYEDEDNDGNTTETYNMSVVLTKVSSPTFVALEAEAAAS